MNDNVCYLHFLLIFNHVMEGGLYSLGLIMYVVKKFLAVYRVCIQKLLFK